MSEAEKKPNPVTDGPLPRRGRRTGVLILLLGLVLAVALGLGLGMVLLERSAKAPDWLRDRIAARVAAAAPGMVLSFDDMSLLLQRDGQISVDLQDVELTGPTGTAIGALSDVQIGLNPLALLRRTGGLREMSVSGVFMTIRRAPDGALGLDVGDMFGSGQEMPGVPEVVAMVDAVLMSPRLSGLRRVQADAVTLRYEDARAQRGWTIDGGRLDLSREGGRLALRGDFAVLGGGAGVATLAVNADSVIGENTLRFGMQLQDVRSFDLATQGPALAWFDALRAPISGSIRAEMFADGSLGPVNATFQIGAGVLQPTDETRPVPFSGARTYFTYAPNTGSLRFDEISLDTDWGQVTAVGRADLLDIERGLPGQMVGQFTLTDINANPGGMFETPVSLTQAEMDWRLRLDPFDLTLGRLRVMDAQLPLRASGRLVAEDNGWGVALDATLDQASPAQILSLWPAEALAKPRKWVADNVYDALLRNAQLSVRLHPEEQPVLFVSAAVSDATLRYARTLPVLTDTSGQFTLMNNRLVALVEQGQITPDQGGALQLAGSSFIIPDTRIKRPPARVQVQAAGTVTAALSFLDTEKMRFLTKAGLSVDVAEGTMTASGHLDLPLKKGVTGKEMLFDFQAVAQDVRTDTLVPGRVLQAPNLTIAVTKSGIDVAGAGTFDGVAFDGMWTQVLGQPGIPGEVTATVPLSDESLRRLGVTLPAGMLRGSTPAALTLTLPKGSPPRFSLTSGLQGLAGRLPSVGWSFGQAQAGQLRVAGQLGTPVRIDTLDIDAGGLKGSARVALTAAGRLRSLSFDELRLGNWLRGPVTITGSGRDMAVRVGGRLDLRNAPFGPGGGNGGGGGGAAAPIELDLERLQISNSLSLTGVTGRIASQSGGVAGRFRGLLNGTAPVSGEIVPVGGRSGVRIASEDAGKLAQASGILKNASGGAMTLELTPAQRPGEFDGQLVATNVRLRNAPAIGALLDAISIVGLLDQLNGSGIYFANIDGKFRLTPNQLILQQFAATGPSMGISLDGFYTLSDGALDMQGVLSPIYLVNGIGSLFTRRGEGLVGFNFNLKGSAASPRVLVNPLSVLTPGMFREIFRRRPPQVSQ